MDIQEKMLGVISEGKERKIVVTHVTIRQSISVLLLRLAVLEILAAFSVILFHTLIISTNVTDIALGTYTDISLFNIPVFLLLVLLKSSLTVFIILQWLNEYYEITPKEIIQRSGIIFRKEEKHLLDHLSSLEIDQNLFGRIFNYGTIKFFNWATEKDVSFYLIHNPMKHYQILQTILPDADKKKKIFREHLIEPEEL